MPRRITQVVPRGDGGDVVVEEGRDARLEEGLAWGCGDEGAGRAGRVRGGGGISDEGLGVCAGTKGAVSGTAAADRTDLVAC